MLGMPGPGPEWKPAPGVKLKLDALGSCRVCSNQFAVPEYICNSASRPGSASSRRSHSNAVQKPRVKMVDAETQTEAKQLVEREVQVTPISAIRRAQATMAG